MTGASRHIFHLERLDAEALKAASEMILRECEKQERGKMGTCGGAMQYIVLCCTVLCCTMELL